MLDDFGKTTIRISPQQARILLDLCNQLDVSEMTPEDVMVLNSLHYSLESVKEMEQGDIA